MDWKLELVVVPVTDMERAKRCYSEQIGFAVDHDTRVDDRMHIVQLTPPGVEVSRVQHYEGADLVGGSGDRWNSFVFFRAPDGNGWPSRSASPTRMPWASVAERQTRRV